MELIELRDKPPTITLAARPSTWLISAPDRTSFEQFYRDSPYHGLGFAFEPQFPHGPAAIGLTGSFLFIPLWFPTLISAGLLWLVWRKTRKTYPGGGFPVEITPPPQTPSAPASP
jgi:hypothetical protein